MFGETCGPSRRPTARRVRRPRLTIARPGMLTDEPGSGRIALGERCEPGSISRDDVAAILAAVLCTPWAAGKSFDAVAGETPVAEAVAARLSELCA